MPSNFQKKLGRDGREFEGDVCPPAGKVSPENFAIFLLKIIGKQGEEQSPLLGHGSFSGHKKRQFRVNRHHAALLKCQFSALNSKVCLELSSARGTFSARIGRVYSFLGEIRARERRVGRSRASPSPIPASLSLWVTFRVPSSSCDPEDGPCAPAEVARPAQLIFHAVKFLLLPVKIQAWMVWGRIDPPHLPQCLGL